ncbi:MAG: hypothetical protein LBS21_13160 [Clostridiales bacterium]|jgi:hypothetical protein|nr:hypothetical protein [Clostridiales bacterium]
MKTHKTTEQTLKQCLRKRFGLSYEEIEAEVSELKDEFNFSRWKSLKHILAAYEREAESIRVKDFLASCGLDKVICANVANVIAY